MNKKETCQKILELLKDVYNKNEIIMITENSFKFLRKGDALNDILSIRNTDHMINNRDRIKSLKGKIEKILEEIEE